MWMAGLGGGSGRSLVAASRWHRAWRATICDVQS